MIGDVARFRYAAIVASIIRFHLVKRFIPILLLLMAGRYSVPAQFDTATTGIPDFARLTKLFGANTNFSAKAELRVLGKNQKEKIFTPLEVSVLERKLRVQIETANVRNVALPPDAADGMKQLGLDRVINLVRPDRRVNYIVFPTLKSFIKTPFTTNDTVAFNGPARMQRTPTGKETIDGRQCLKQKVLLTDAQGGRSEFTVWEAASLQNFPVQIATRDRDDTVLLRFRQVKLARPESKDFEPPANFSEHKDVHAFMTSVLERHALASRKTVKPSPKR